MLRILTACLFSISTFVFAAPESVVSEGVVAADVSEVWTACTTSAGLRSWLAPHADIDLRVEGLMRANYAPDGKLGDAGTIENRILAYEPQRLLVLRVAKAPDKFPFRSRVGEMWTILYFQPTAERKTRLRIVGQGFGADGDSQKMRDFFQQGNDYTLTLLQKRFP